MVARMIAVCEPQPITSEGLRALIRTCTDLAFCRATRSLEGAAEIVRQMQPAVLVIDKSFGIPLISDWLANAQGWREHTSYVVWGNGMTESEALRLVQSGARGVIRKTAETATMLACLRCVASGATWMEDSLFRQSPRAAVVEDIRNHLTQREREVLDLVERGLKNKEIADELGIRPGTVKIHLKHIFEKTGVRGRYGLALTGLKEKGLLHMPEG